MKGASKLNNPTPWVFFWVLSRHQKYSCKYILDIEFYLFFLQFEEQLLHAKCTCRVLIMNIIVEGPNPFCAT